MNDILRDSLRKTIREIREQLPDDFKVRAAKQIFRILSKTEIYRYAKHVALYRSIRGEVSTNDFRQSAPLQGKYCYYPVLNTENRLSFLQAFPNTKFKPNKFNILEPDVEIDKAIDINELDIVIVPLLAFDEYGNRLGFGGGFYDKTFSQSDREQGPKLIGIAYELQKQSLIPTEYWDISLDAIVTEEKIYWAS